MSCKRLLIDNGEKEEDDSEYQTLIKELREKGQNRSINLTKGSAIAAAPNTTAYQIANVNIINTETKGIASLLNKELKKVPYQKNKFKEKDESPLGFSKSKEVKEAEIDTQSTLKRKNLRNRKKIKDEKERKINKRENENNVGHIVKASQETYLEKTTLKILLPICLICTFIIWLISFLKNSKGKQSETDKNNFPSVKVLYDFYRSEENSSIKRIFGEKLSISTDYVELQIVAKANNQEEEKKEEEEKNNLFRLSYNNINVNKKNEEEDRVILGNFFDRKADEILKNKENPRRILIKGRPGIGKSILSKRIVHEFLKEEQGLWRDKFDYLIWLPLRNLANYANFLEFSFEELLHHEYFSFTIENSGRKLAYELKNLINENIDRTLFLLDGWDEASNIPHTSAIGKILNYLLEQKNIIAISRHYSLPDVSFDLELEVIGFNQESVDTYIDHVLPLDSAISKEIKYFTKHYPFADGLLNIPLQLDMLCISWDILKKKNKKNLVDSHITLTELYNAITIKLWINYLQRPQIKESLERKNEVKINELKLLDSEPLSLGEKKIRLMTKEEQIDLENLSFKALIFQNKLLLHHDFLIAQDFNSSLDNIRQTNFITTTANANAIKRGEAEYYFIHPTIQEFFAASYIVRHFPTLDIFITDNKYNPNFEIVWWFVSGLLTAQAINLNNFFKIMFHEAPSDEIGLYQRSQLIRYLEECKTSNSLINKQVYITDIVQALIKSIEESKNGCKSMYGHLNSLVKTLKISPMVALEPDIKKIFENLLKEDNWQEKSIFLISELEVINDKNIEIFKKVFDDPNHPVYFTQKILKILVRHDPYFISNLISKLNDTNQSLLTRKKILFALYELRDINSEIFEIMIKIVDSDQDESLRILAIGLIGNLINKLNYSNKIENTLLTQLNLGPNVIRFHAAEALGKLSRNSSDVILALNEQLFKIQDKDPSIHREVQVIIAKSLGQLGKNNKTIENLFNYLELLIASGITHGSRKSFMYFPVVMYAFLKAQPSNDMILQIFSKLKSYVTVFKNTIFSQLLYDTIGLLNEDQKTNLNITNFLHSLINFEDEPLQVRTIMALGKRTQINNQIVSILLQALKHTDSIVCCEAVNALLKLEIANKELSNFKNALENTTDKIARLCISKALIRISPPNEFPLNFILKALWENDSETIDVGFFIIDLYKYVIENKIICSTLNSSKFEVKKYLMSFLIKVFILQETAVYIINNKLLWYDHNGLLNECLFSSDEKEIIIEIINSFHKLKTFKNNMGSNFNNNILEANKLTLPLSIVNVHDNIESKEHFNVRDILWIESKEFDESISSEHMSIMLSTVKQGAPEMKKYDLQLNSLPIFTSASPKHFSSWLLIWRQIIDKLKKFRQDVFIFQALNNNTTFNLSNQLTSLPFVNLEQNFKDESATGKKEILNNTLTALLENNLAESLLLEANLTDVVRPDIISNMMLGVVLIKIAENTFKSVTTGIYYLFTKFFLSEEKQSSETTEADFVNRCKLINMQNKCRKLREAGNSTDKWFDYFLEDLENDIEDALNIDTVTPYIIDNYQTRLRNLVREFNDDYTEVDYAAIYSLNKQKQAKKEKRKAATTHSVTTCSMFTANTNEMQILSISSNQTTRKRSIKLSITHKL